MFFWNVLHVFLAAKLKFSYLTHACTYTPVWAENKPYTQTTGRAVFVVWVAVVSHLRGSWTPRKFLFYFCWFFSLVCFFCFCPFTDFFFLYKVAYLIRDSWRKVEASCFYHCSLNIHRTILRLYYDSGIVGFHYLFRLILSW